MRTGGAAKVQANACMSYAAIAHAVSMSYGISSALARWCFVDRDHGGVDEYPHPTPL